MNDKCEWKDGKFEGCDKHMEVINGTIIIENPKRLFADGVIFCPFCGADIRKPEPPEPLIVESGKTWVCEDYKGINYICIDPVSLGTIYDFNKFIYMGFNQDYFSESSNWKSFTGDNPDITELTDELALLRPMVVCECGCARVFKFYGICTESEDEYKYIGWDNQGKDIANWDTCRLATAKELQEAHE